MLFVAVMFVIAIFQWTGGEREEAEAAMVFTLIMALAALAALLADYLIRRAY